MKIGIDITPVGKNSAGIGYYTSELVKALLAWDSKNNYVLFTNNLSNQADIVNYLSKKNLKNYKVVEVKSKKPGLFWMYKVVSLINREKFNLFISTSNFMFGILYKNTIQFIHDLAPLKFPQFFKVSSVFMYRLQLLLYKFRHKIIAAISNTVREEIIQEYKINPEKIVNIGAGLHEWTIIKTSVEELERVKLKYTLPQKYFLSLSTLEPRKNHLNMISAFAKVLKEYPEYTYVIAGKKGWFFENIFTKVKELKLENNVKFLDYVPEEDLPALLDLSAGLLMCSFYEGIGLPPLEAQSRGVPVVLSNINVFKENFNDNNAYLANPKSDIEISAKMVELINDYPKKIRNNIQNDFNWTKSAIELAKQYRFFI